jgi:hypothetical protein
MKQLRRELRRVESDLKKRPMKMAPRWRVILARVGIVRPLARWTIAEDVRRAIALKMAMKKTTHSVVKGSN